MYMAINGLIMGVCLTWLNTDVLSKLKIPFSSLFKLTDPATVYLRCCFSTSVCLLQFTGIFSWPLLYLHFTPPHQTTLDCLSWAIYFCPGSGCCTPDGWILKVCLSVEYHLQPHLCTPKFLLLD